jgi:endonuclease YncB( thermonuclease family)
MRCLPVAGRFHPGLALEPVPKPRRGKRADSLAGAHAVCKLPDGFDVNAWLLRQGWALATGFVKTYESEQDEAAAAKRGIGAGTFTPPWKWRLDHPRQSASP